MPQPWLQGAATPLGGNEVQNRQQLSQVMVLHFVAVVADVVVVATAAVAFAFVAVQNRQQLS